MAMKKKYRVLNPRDIDPHVRIIYGEYQGVSHEWFVGDELVPPPGMSKADIDWLLHVGLIEVATDA